MTAALVLFTVGALFVGLCVDGWFNPPRVYVPKTRHHDPAGWTAPIPAYPAWLYDPVDLTAGTSFNTDGSWCANGEQPSPRRRHYPPTDLGLDWDEPPALPPTLPHDWPGLDLAAVPTGEEAT